MPEIIDIEEVESNNLVRISSVDFIKFINRENVDVIYRSSQRFFHMKDGFCFYTDHCNYSFEDFSKITEKIVENGFSNIRLYDEAKEFGKFDDEKDYILFQIGFSPNYDDYVEIKKRGFIVDFKKLLLKMSTDDGIKKVENICFNIRWDYLEAKSLGIDIPEEFISFEESDFYDEKYIDGLFDKAGNLNDSYAEEHKALNLKRLKEFKEAKSMDFNIRCNYLEAKLLGIDICEEFISFKESDFYDEKYSNNLFDSDGNLNDSYAKEHKALNLKRLKEFKEAKSVDFYIRCNYLEAKLLGIDIPEEFISFKESDFYDEKYSNNLFDRAGNLYDPYDKEHKALNLKRFKKFKEAKEMGFDNILDYKICKIKKMVLDLGTKFTRLGVGEISEKCNVVDDNLIIEVIKEMINNKEIYAEYFSSSESVAFNQQANIKEIDKLMKTYDQWEESKFGEKLE